jgi:hypothetical protein
MFVLLFCSLKYYKIENHFVFELVKKKIWTILQRIVELLLKKLSLSYQKYEFGIRDPEKTYSGFRIQGKKDTGSRNRIRNTGQI